MSPQKGGGYERLLSTPHFNIDRLVPLRVSQKAKGFHAKGLISKDFRILLLAGYFRRTALVVHSLKSFYISL